MDDRTPVDFAHQRLDDMNTRVKALEGQAERMDQLHPGELGAAIPSDKPVPHVTSAEELAAECRKADDRATEAEIRADRAERRVEELERKGASERIDGATEIPHTDEHAKRAANKPRAKWRTGKAMFLQLVDEPDVKLDAVLDREFDVTADEWRYTVAKPDGTAVFLLEKEFECGCPFCTLGRAVKGETVVDVAPGFRLFDLVFGRGAPNNPHDAKPAADPSDPRSSD